jgi:phosphatidylglycerol---prolipoprotein diacylglyceryl transferase
LHPTLLKLGSFQIHSYGLLLAIAFLVAIQIFVVRGKRRGIPEDALHTVSLVLLILAIIGGRGLFVVTHWSDYASDPVGIFRLWEGGLMLYGGYILAIAGGILYVKRAKLPLWKVADAAAPAMALGIGIGRIGCFLNGCCFGLPTHAAWGVQFPPGSYSTFVFPGAHVHPSQLYMTLGGVLLFAVLLRLDRKPRFDGYLFWMAVALDSILRFGIDFTRYYDSTSFLGTVGGLSFNINQILSVFLFLTSMVMLRILSRRGVAVGAPPPAAGGAPDATSPSGLPPRADLAVQPTGATEPRSTR